MDTSDRAALQDLLRLVDGPASALMPGAVVTQETGMRVLFWSTHEHPNPQ